MTLVSYSTWSVLGSPLGGVETPEDWDDDVSCPLDNVGNVTIGLEKRLSSLEPVIMTRIEKRSRSEKIRIANMEIPKIINPEFVFIPVKGGKPNVLIDLEELMNVFPCSWVVARHLYLLRSIMELTNVTDCGNVRIGPKHTEIVEDSTV
jgi:hypothetical protein